MSSREPGIIQEFRKLYDYVRLMGDHINQIHKRIEEIEKSVNEISVNHRRSINENANEITSIRSNMVNKYELDDFIEKMKSSVGEQFPSLPELMDKGPELSDGPLGSREEQSQ